MKFTYRPFSIHAISHWLILGLIFLCVQSWAATPMVAVGSEHSCAMNSSGGVSCWGDNNGGQLGNGTRTTSFVPVPVTGIDDAVSISAAGNTTCALSKSGLVRCWGSNASGQFGNGTVVSSLTPVLAIGVESAIAISVGAGYGDGHTCAVISSGGVKCWGSNAYGQLGDGTTSDSSLPVSVSNLRDAVSVATAAHTCALIKGGGVRCWGSNHFGQLGIGSQVFSTTPVEIRGISDAVQISINDYFSCVALNTGKVACWGTDRNQIVEYYPTEHAIPVVLPLIEGVKSISLPFQRGYACAVLISNAIRCWGDENYQGQLGIGSQSTASRTTNVIGISDAALVSSAKSHSCATLYDGTVQCWGGNNYGKLGNGSEVNSYVPVTVVGRNGQGVLNVGVTPKSNLATDADKVFAWAEKTYPDIFAPGSQASQAIAGYRYRSYNSGHFLAVNDNGTPHLFYLGPLNNNTVLDFGLLANWVTQVGQ